MKNFIKKITGLDKEQEKLDADKKELAKQEEELLSKRDPKAYATRKKQPWVGVLDVKVNEKNVRNGFFELDWNKYFIEQLINAGYGVANDPEEEIVDRWFRDIVGNILEDEGLDKERGSGYINVVPISKGKSEIS
jgi:hypothetical protein|tara:strand:- start:146 stop:550 length:405 start_codon:yes stop_codon:yes gene_type:complete